LGIPVIFVLIYLGSFYLFALSLILQTFCLWEFLTIFKNRNIIPIKITTLIISVILSFIAFFKTNIFLPVILFSVLIIVSEELFRGEKRSPVNLALNVTGLLYITVPFILLNDIGKNFYLVASVFIMIWVCDIFAFFGGKYFGKHKLTSISPKKTIEGSVFGFVFTIMTAFILFYFSNNFFTLIDFLVIGIIIGVVSQIGDLFESFLKRFCEVKDSSNIIPGHGGVLDRFDSLIFVIPIIFIYINYIK